MWEQKIEILRAEHLRKYFTTPKGILHVMDDANFSIHIGEILGMVGKSGCRKFAIGRATLRLHKPTDGEAYLKGKDILGCSKRQLKGLRKDMQIIPQNPFASLNSRVTASEAIIELLLMQGVYRASRRAVITRQVGKVINLVGPAKRLINTCPHGLDGNKHRRIGIARALAVNPKFTVYNELMSTLGISIQTQTFSSMQDLQEKLSLTYMFVIHDLPMVGHFSNDTAATYLGQMVESAPAKTLSKNPMHPYTKALLSAIPVPDPDFKVERIPLKGELTSPISPEPGCRFAKHCLYATEGCINSEATLEEMESEHLTSCRTVQEQG